MMLKLKSHTDEIIKNYTKACIIFGDNAKLVFRQLQDSPNREENTSIYEEIFGRLFKEIIIITVSILKI